MAYYYQNHLRNLEEEALLENRKIAAELQERSLLKQHEVSKVNGRCSIPNKSRREEDNQTAAFLEKSRLSAQLSAMRSKAESSMTRSRLESAFELRKENQKAIQEMNKLNQKHSLALQQSQRESVQAYTNLAVGQRVVQETMRRQLLLGEMLSRENLLSDYYRSSVYNSEWGRRGPFYSF